MYATELLIVSAEEFLARSSIANLGADLNANLEVKDYAGEAAAFLLPLRRHRQNPKTLMTRTRRSFELRCNNEPGWLAYKLAFAGIGGLLECGIRCN
jgi:hypothetical protein